MLFAQVEELEEECEVESFSEEVRHPNILFLQLAKSHSVFSLTNTVNSLNLLKEVCEVDGEKKVRVN